MLPAGQLRLRAHPDGAPERDRRPRRVHVHRRQRRTFPTGSAPNILDRDFTITAHVTVPKGGGEGVIVTEGGRFGGYALYLSRSFNWWYHEALFRRIALAVLALGLLLSWRAPAKSRAGRVLMGTGAALVVIVFATGILGLGKGKPVFTYNLLDLERTSWTGSALGAGKHTVVFDFKYDGPGPGKGGTGVLTVDGKAMERKELKHTVPLFFTISETFDVGGRPPDRRGRPRLPVAVRVHRHRRYAQDQGRAGPDVGAREAGDGGGDRESEQLDRDASPRIHHGRGARHRVRPGGRARVRGESPAGD